HVLPKEELMFRGGEMFIEVEKRVRPYDEPSEAAGIERDREVTKQMRHYYQVHYAALCEELETPDYWRYFRKYQAYYSL
ncbi:MAG: hypothetical protein IKO81_03575, partial [Bacteroidales bacterium]|nr:hypothetical protein [Bacteroidales bacterium]